MSAPDLRSLLIEFAPDVTRFVQARAGRLLRFESAEDLSQAIQLRALERGGSFQYGGREPFLGWLHKVARSHLADRHAYWSALRRRPAALLRLTFGATPAPGQPAASMPPGADTGPQTFADRREQVELAIKALALLLPRDQNLIQWASEGVDITEQASRLGLSYDAAERAGARARDRFRKAFRLARRAR